MQLKVKSVGNTNPSGRGMNGNVFDSDYLCPTLTTNKGEGIKILIKNATKKGYLIANDGDGIDTAYPDSKTRRGRVQKNMAHTITTDDSKGVVIGTIYTNVSKRFQRGVYKNLSRTVKANNHDLSVVIAASRGRYPKNPSGLKTMSGQDLRIRKLTPKECWRLMGCTDEDFHKAEQVNSNSQLYKQAGNAIVVDVLEAIFKQMFLK